MAKRESRRHYGSRTVETSNEDKVLFGSGGPTKGELIDYYEQIADRILPHLRDHPLVLQRFPDGIEEEGFYQKQASDYFPDWIERVRVDVAATDGHQELVVCDAVSVLGYLANQACIALHPWLSRTDRLDHPDRLVIDLDPPGDDFGAARVAALRVRALCEELELPAYAKWTGSTGIHVVIPLDRSDDFDAVRAFATDAMALLAERHADTLTTAHRKDDRRGRVYLDVGRNAYAQTAVAPWSVRALPGAPVAATIPWSLLERKRSRPPDFTLRNVLEKTRDREDPWAGWRRRARSLDEARKRLADLRD